MKYMEIFGNCIKNLTSEINFRKFCAPNPYVTAQNEFYRSAQVDSIVGHVPRTFKLSALLLVLVKRCLYNRCHKEISGDLPLKFLALLHAADILRRQSS